ncbi:enolase 4 isoform X1 [Erpetoichthys calabaricus]|uniref:enolase 4 isoform X1 n=2 Tax=Erpetoichthys calabaricus TaxID=27687 RepID=UPI00109F1653|nr:enolase 4 isoform X1 [Erpetoichthys calabaricus]
MSYTGFLGNTRVSKEVREFYELKQKAAEYYRASGIVQNLEDALNKMFYDKPEDMCGYLSNYFAKLSQPPVISRLLGREVYDGMGQLSVQVDVYCTVKNEEKRVCTAAISSHCEPPDVAFPEAYACDDVRRSEAVRTALQWIGEPLTELLKDHQPDEQDRLDDLLSNFFTVQFAEEQERLQKKKEQRSEEAPPAESPAKPAVPSSGKKEKAASGKAKKGNISEKPIPPAEPQEPVLQGSVAVGSVSLAVAKAAATLRSIPLYQHIASLKHPQQPASELNIPLPMITVISCGKLSPGKLNLMKEVIAIPAPGLTFKQGFQMIRQLQAQMTKQLDAASKAGPASKPQSHLGSMVLSFDRMEQPLDLVMEAAKALELTVGKDIHLAVNCAAHELVDYQKGKYEIANGTAKNPDEMVDVLVDLLNRYPAVIALIDPLRREDKEQWTSLYTAVQSKCYLFAEGTSKSIGFLLAEPDQIMSQASGLVLRHTNETTISDLIHMTTKLKDRNQIHVLGTADGEPCDDSLSDLAVGLGARFVKLGGLCRGERVTKYGRLLSIEEELARQGALGLCTEHKFPEHFEEVDESQPSAS